ncbi:unnamed protein product [Rhizophagus irregularis]|nr:unnamed protein product [Rhizophagus irregularis]
MKTLLNLENEEVTIMQRINNLIEELPSIRNQARKKKKKKYIERSQKKQKKYHNEKYKMKRNFQIGDKVLYYDAAKEKQWSEKLEEKWKGPYYIHKIVVNGELLKEYTDRSNFEVIIKI